MYKTITLFSALVLAVSMIGGCANWKNSDTGTLLGGAAGGALGSQIGSGTGTTIATVVGTLAGAALGNKVGQHFDQKDRRQFGTALESNQTGKTTSWNDPNSNESYSVTPTRTYKQGNQPCRDFTMNATINGQPKKVTGTACRQPNGTWKVVNS
ncbi:RT0821/Lpp0805 family surface protein [Salinisphaera sp. LB1]|uniref:RT0821/Lpp0805 family surface protein n=1 Tax=Salinisphaera sp. LB1 TaxID=2183911 RepID=UPI000D7055BD|nr:RT0821/Lpp0805 family surface protein [Salinisphaera sp. LB1]AWN16859.1 17 kDa surface antigen precursor [Salinisphaera sp. LB1]